VLLIEKGLDFVPKDDKTKAEIDLFLLSLRTFPREYGSTPGGHIVTGQQKATAVNPVELRTLHQDEDTLLKYIMIRMYTDSPSAYNETVAQAEQRSADEWKQLTHLLATGDVGVAFVASVDQEICGFALGILIGDDGKLGQPNATKTAAFGRLWVAPQVRRRGVGQALVEAVVNWARTRSLKRIELWVGEENQAAVQLYQRVGFQTIRSGETAAECPGITFYVMSLDVDTTISEPMEGKV
jgi:ribosomal protein S18 acetylase RimI-like enzyme